MKLHPVPATLALAALTAFGLSACGGAAEGVPGGPAASTPAPTAMSMALGETMTPGMTMAPSTSAPSTPSANAARVAEPSAKTKMVCGDETMDNVKGLAGVDTVPTKTSWKDGLFTCTYDLAEGQLIITVKQSADADAAKAHFDGIRKGVDEARDLTGLESLGVPSYRTTDGLAVFVKDEMTLTVDPTRLAATVGPEKTERSSFAYTVATTILACWTEHP
ncbi:MAG: hypothetical protein ABIS35_01540 [Terracoccus sp.]